MKAFITAFPRTNNTNKRAKPDENKENTSAKRTTSIGNKGQPRQMFLDLGQKTFGKSKECTICGMLYVLGDHDDEQRHKQNCSKMRDGPILTSLKGLKVVAEVEDKRGGKGSILEIRQMQCKGSHIHSSNAANFPVGIVDVLTLVNKELGSSVDEVSNHRYRQHSAVLSYLCRLHF